MATYISPILNLTECPLCLSNEHACCQSHLISKYFIKRYKKTHKGPVRVFSKGVRPQQDLPKIMLLCSNCEQLTSIDESILLGYLPRCIIPKIHHTKAQKALVGYLWKTATAQLRFSVLWNKPAKIPHEWLEILRYVPYVMYPYWVSEVEKKMKEWGLFVLGKSKSLPLSIRLTQCSTDTLQKGLKYHVKGLHPMGIHPEWVQSNGVLSLVLIVTIDETTMLIEGIVGDDLKVANYLNDPNIGHIVRTRALRKIWSE